MVITANVQIQNPGNRNRAYEKKLKLFRGINFIGNSKTKHIKGFKDK